jgi:hypothetical protein
LRTFKHHPHGGQRGESVAEVTPDGQVIKEWFGRKGATFKYRFQWKTGLTAGAAIPVNFTGWIGRLHFKVKADDTEIALALTTENGGIALGVGGDGWVDVLVTATQAKALPKKVVFDLELEHPPTEFVRNIMGGTFVLGSNVTQEV